MFPVTTASAAKNLPAFTAVDWSARSDSEKSLPGAFLKSVLSTMVKFFKRLNLTISIQRWPDHAQVAPYQIMEVLQDAEFLYRRAN
jgi:hypothetical protein